MGANRSFVFPQGTNREEVEVQLVPNLVGIGAQRRAARNVGWVGPRHNLATPPSQHAPSSPVRNPRRSPVAIQATTSEEDRATMDLDPKLGT